MEILQLISIISLIAGVLCAVIIVIDILLGHRQHMMVMNIVYPLTGLYAGPLALWIYYTIGRKSTKQSMMHNSGKHHNMHDMQHMHQSKKPFWQSVAVGTLHCGSGCTLGDILAEGFLLIVPVTFLGSKLYGAWVIDFVFAFIIGIIFQYYAIKPMKKLSSGEAFKAAVKADTLSLTCWQIGMYGWMAIATF